jgi:hypothetical protein
VEGTGGGRTGGRPTGTYAGAVDVGASDGIARYVELADCFIDSELYEESADSAGAGVGPYGDCFIDRALYDESARSVGAAVGPYVLTAHWSPVATGP